MAMMREGDAPDMTLASSVTIDDVRRAAERIAGHAVRTPVLTSARLDAMLGVRAFFKCENLQRVGAFKFRGALNAMSALDGDARTRGVLAYSSGNHAQAIALAASLLGVRAVIVMPEDAPRTKLDGTRAYLEISGRSAGEIVTYDPKTTLREELGGSIARERGLTIIPPYDHPDVIAGQGTAGLELLEEVGELDELYVCTGGGGLLSGCAIAAKAMSPRCLVVGVEPEAGDDATRSFASGRLCTVRNPGTICDGARTPYLGRYTFPLVVRYVDAMATVDDAEVVAAMRLAMEHLKIVVEPTGVLGLAGMVKSVREVGSRDGATRRVGVVVSGGNVDLDALAGLLGRG
ncbi:MAG: threo-3-hydroxy-L-aspartate ammonia-lyase [Phycisphaerales bacterium]|nr:threo-3-hydroxy-L-aspartate ammonia-lyase [Phycisphaerales bacterium]